VNGKRLPSFLAFFATLLVPALAFAAGGDSGSGSESTVLSWITFTPLIGAALILLMPAAMKPYIKYVATLATAVPLALAIWLFMNFDRNLVANLPLLASTGPSYEYAKYGLQFVHHFVWVKSFHIEYFMGVDGISISMVLLTALVSFIACISSWYVSKPVVDHDGHRYFAGIQDREKGYYMLYLLLVTGMFGTFCALDFFLFYVFWELMLLPMYFLIGIWGGPRKEYAAIKFFLYTLAGSVLMLLAIIYLYYNAHSTAPGGLFTMKDGSATTNTFNMLFMQFHTKITWGKLITEPMVWTALFIGFAIKIPMFPFHTWLPDAHVEAPTPISVILAGVLLKMGTYGIFRINYGIMPHTTFDMATVIAVFGVINILYGAYCAMAQSDLKKLVAYSSVSHMGFVLLGMSAFNVEGFNGAVMQMFNHGTITSMLFLLVGVIYDRAHHRQIDGFGGLAKIVPMYTFIVGIAWFASLGLPGFSGFIGEILCFLGGFQRHTWLTVAAATSVVVTAAYLLWSLQRMFLGQVNAKYLHITDLNAREFATLVPLAVITLILGFYPMPVLDLISGGLGTLNEFILNANAQQAVRTVAGL